MNKNYDNFVIWFKKPMEMLYPNGDAGFVVLMTSLPLIERFLREVSGAHEGNLNDRFHDDFAKIFDLKNRDDARTFWQIYRNGLLHQAALCGVNRNGTILPRAALSGHAPLITYDANENIFYVHPEDFARRVVKVIEDDFATYEASSSRSHPLPQITSGNLTGLSNLPPPTGVR
jgi:hypothetical protein